MLTYGGILRSGLVLALLFSIQLRAEGHNHRPQVTDGATNEPADGPAQRTGKDTMEAMHAKMMAQMSSGQMMGGCQGHGTHTNSSTDSKK
jgi:hypothetical protein